MTVLTSSDARQSSLLDDYAPLTGVYDELLDAQGHSRPGWQTFCRQLGELATGEFARRWDQAQNLLHENGIAFGAYGDSENPLRPWVVDPLPLLIAADQWQRVAAGLAQRARLLDRLLADLYGPQILISRRVLPAELIFRHPGFFRVYHGQRPVGNRFLSCYAADLARGSDGHWWVLADRSEAPSGLGFALENRIVVSRMLPDVFHRCQVERLAPHFLALQQMLAESAPQHRDNPRIVLLSQGPGTPNYFEDAYLARYLGYTLVEAGDLAVRNGQVMLKGLAARYVSGYLRTLPPPGQARMVGADASHAWFAVYAGSCGWVDFDPTNRLLVDTDHITLAWGRDYSDVAPVRGVFVGAGTHAVSVSVDVVPDDA